MTENIILTEEQKKAAAHIGRPALLIAGPGTGKTHTLVERVDRLITQKNVPPSKIRVITFTRATARDLRNRIVRDAPPQISTLHSYALSQLLKAGEAVYTLPQPLRVADDWEERYIILEDLKIRCALKSISKAQSHLNDLSADWQSLDADKSEVARALSPDRRKFLAVWNQHRGVYGYTLRAELVYQLKKSLEQRGDFRLDTPEHLLVDEYQDLNQCDLAVVRSLELHGAELYAAGDDDQSIYGFRNAAPDGIRRFCDDYNGVARFLLTVCKRCAPNILELGEHVASLDPCRISKIVNPEPDRTAGEVKILRFSNQHTEAGGIASICKRLLKNGGVERAGDILILLRDNNRGVFSSLINDHLVKAGISVKISEIQKPLGRDDSRILFSFMRLAVNHEDSLAWRTLFDKWDGAKGVGIKSVNAIYQAALESGKTFAQQIALPNADELLGGRIMSAVNEINCMVKKLFPDTGDKKYELQGDLMRVIHAVAERLIKDCSEREFVIAEFKRIVETTENPSISDLVRGVSTVDEDIEQEPDAEKISIMTMHRAKGLTAKAVIVAGAENERIPGRAEGEKEIGEERRLLYVSLTRAKDYLFVTYCDRRIEQQAHTGKNTGTLRRSLTKFLRDCSLKPIDGSEYTRES